MSIILVDAGQCGNQLGYEILDSLFDHFQLESNNGSDNEFDFDVYFRSSKKGHIARAVLLDTEPKVINECVRRSKTQTNWRFDSRSICYRHGGAGNNWAQGSMPF
jgi:hypothetical protein